MINGINYYSVNNNYSKAMGTNSDKAENKRAKISFGYGEDSQSPFQKLKDLAVILTNDAVGFIGVNAVLWGIQKFVNNDILIGKINKHFTKDIDAKNIDKLDTLADEMLDKKGLTDKVERFIGPNGEAYFDHKQKIIVVGKDKYSALFHEIGHAVEENKTTLFKNLQRGRGHYAEASLLLYALLGQNKSNDSKLSTVVPLLAFAPELITEAKASLEGLKFLKEKVKLQQLEKSVFKKIRNSYLTCFATYLFIPVSIMLVDAIKHSADNAIQRRKMERQQVYF